MRLAHPLRLALSGVLSLALAVIVAAHSASIALTHKASVTALALFPQNGLSQEAVASDVFRSVLATAKQSSRAALEARKLAYVSYQNEPLVAEAHAILALVAEDTTARTYIIRTASGMNKRDQLLQGLLLEQSVSDDDSQLAVATLDQILRVRPSRDTELFPALLSVFIADGAVEYFATVLDGTSPWHERFLNYAIAQGEALGSMAELRRRIQFGDERIDQALIRNLAKEGQFDAGYELYSQISRGASSYEASGNLGWSSKFAPYDWQLSNKADFRAQPSLDSNELEIYVRPGSGGLLARRILLTPSAPFSITAGHDIYPRDRAEDVKIRLRCVGEREPFQSAEFDANGLRVSIEQMPLRCSLFEIQLLARAWTGQPAISGSISPIQIER